MKIHVLGICGTFMGGLAQIARALGHEVSGSDANVYPPMSNFLEQIKVKVYSGYSPENLHPPADLVIVGNVISKPNPEAQELARLRLPYLSMPQAIARFYISGKTSLVVTGTHGKTTTTSIVGSVLAADREPPEDLDGAEGRILARAGTSFAALFGRHKKCG